jgi:hypothetical protein
VKRQHKNQRNDAVRMELKYCERCGSLWLRPSGTESVYCENCQPKVAELPPPKKHPGRVQLPVARTSMVERYDEQEEYADGMDPEEMDFDAAGGVA